MFGIFFGKDGITIGNQAYDLGMTKKYKWAGDGAIAESVNLPALGDKIRASSASTVICRCSRPVQHAHHRHFFDEAVAS